MFSRANLQDDVEFIEGNRTEIIKSLNDGIIPESFVEQLKVYIEKNNTFTYINFKELHFEIGHCGIVTYMSYPQFYSYLSYEGKTLCEKFIWYFEMMKQYLDSNYILISSNVCILKTYFIEKVCSNGFKYFENIESIYQTLLQMSNREVLGYYSSDVIEFIMEAFDDEYGFHIGFYDNTWTFIFYLLPERDEIPEDVQKKIKSAIISGIIDKTMIAKFELKNPSPFTSGVVDELLQSGYVIQQIRENRYKDVLDFVVAIGGTM